MRMVVSKVLTSWSWSQVKLLWSHLRDSASGWVRFISITKDASRVSPWHVKEERNGGLTCIQTVDDDPAQSIGAHLGPRLRDGVVLVLACPRSFGQPITFYLFEPRNPYKRKRERKTLAPSMLRIRIPTHDKGVPDRFSPVLPIYEGGKMVAESGAVVLDPMMNPCGQDEGYGQREEKCTQG